MSKDIIGLLKLAVAREVVLAPQSSTSLRKAMRQIIVPPKFSATFISKTFYPYEHKHKMHSSINMGRCYDWAFTAYAIWPDLILWSTPHHAWVQMNDRY